MDRASLNLISVLTAAPLALALGLDLGLNPLVEARRPSRPYREPRPGPRYGKASQGPYRTPAVPYPADALEPYISERTVRLHHDVNQEAYTRGLNRSLDTLRTLRRDRSMKSTERGQRRLAAYRALAFNSAGAILHDLYWENMRPSGGPGPKGRLLRAIENEYGGLEDFEHEFDELAAAIRGSGWVVLAWSPWLLRLLLLPVGQHQKEVVVGVIPLLVCDVWEHAYYLDRGPDRNAYLSAFWEIVNWAEVAKRFRRATR